MIRFKEYLQILKESPALGKESSDFWGQDLSHLDKTFLIKKND